MPKPPLRRVATLVTQAKIATKPINTAVTKGSQRFSNKICAKPVFFAASVAGLNFGLRCLARKMRKKVTALNSATNTQGEIPKVS